jgi:type II secretory pathway component GspD/PulD (secretin)
MRLHHVLSTALSTLLVASFSAAQTTTPSSSPSPGTFSSPCPPVEVCDVLNQYASLTHLKIIRDNFVQGKVSIDDVSRLPRERAIEMIERSLFANMFAIVQIDSDTVEVVGTGWNPRGIGVPVLTVPKQVPKSERVISYVFKFKYRDAREMQQVIGQYLSPPKSYTSAIVEGKSNTLLVTERTSVIRSLIDVVKRMDIPDAKKEP